MRLYRKDDLAEIMTIADTAWASIFKMRREALGDQISDFLNPAGDAKTKGLQVKAQIESGQYEIAVCEHENHIVGFITYQIHGKSAQINNNAAAKDTGLKGIGQTMYRWFLDRCREKQVRFISVYTGLDWAHAPARRAYERAGFRRHLDHVTYYLDLEEAEDWEQK